MHCSPLLGQFRLCLQTALDSAIQMRDDSVIVDILNVLNDKP